MHLNTYSNPKIAQIRVSWKYSKLIYIFQEEWKELNKIFYKNDEYSI